MEQNINNNGQMVNCNFNINKIDNSVYKPFNERTNDELLAEEWRIMPLRKERERKKFFDFFTLMVVLAIIFIMISVAERLLSNLVESNYYFWIVRLLVGIVAYGAAQQYCELDPEVEVFNNALKEIDSILKYRGYRK